MKIAIFETDAHNIKSQQQMINKRKHIIICSLLCLYKNYRFFSAAIKLVFDLFIGQQCCTQAEERHRCFSAILW